MTKVALITGISGQDGSYFAEFLLEKGYEVHGIIRRSSSFNTARIEHLYIEELIKDRLEALLMAAEVPFDESGLSQVESKIAAACDSLLEDGGITSYVVDMPLFSSISATDKASRVLNDVKVTVTLAGHIQTISIALKLVI